MTQNTIHTYPIHFPYVLLQVTATNLVGTWQTVTGPIYVQYMLFNALRVETRHVWALNYPDYKTEVQKNQTAMYL